MTQALRIVCFGSSRVSRGDEAWKLADAVGEILGRRGLIAVSGGYQGTMGAVSEGARRVGGRVVGVTTSIFRERRANEHLDEEYVEPDYPARLAMLMRHGHGFVALPGALGTASEWITAWCLGTIDQLGGPLWAFEDPWRPVANALMALPEVDERTAAVLRWVRDPAHLDSELDRWLEARA
jgi:uncharacterized protein (TIGR00730 family)